MTAERSYQGLSHYINKSVVEELSRVPGSARSLSSVAPEERYRYYSMLKGLRPTGSRPMP